MRAEPAGALTSAPARHAGGVRLTASAMAAVVSLTVLVIGRRFVQAVLEEFLAAIYVP
jgi:hypothetical protein